MKKLLLSLFCIIAASLAANAETETLTFSKTPATKKQVVTVNGNTLTWSITQNDVKDSNGKESTDYYYGLSTGVLQMGKNAAWPGELTLSTSGLSDKIIKTISVKQTRGGATGTNLSVSVNGTNYNCGTSSTIALSTTLTDYTFDVDALGGDIEIKYESTSKKAIYLKSIEIEYTDAVAGPKDFNLGFDNLDVFESTSIDINSMLPTKHPEITYTLEPTDVITLDGTKIFGNKIGYATINYSWEATENWNAGEGSFTVSVKEVTDANFDFSGENHGLKVCSSSDYHPKGTSITSGLATIVLNGERSRLWKKTDNTIEMRVYSGASWEISVPEEFYITSIVLDKNGNQFKIENKNFESDTKTWKPADNSFLSKVTMKPSFTSGNQPFTAMTVNYERRPVVAEPVIDFGVKINDDGSIAHHTVLINETEDDVTYEAYIDYEDGLQGETKLAFNNGEFDPIMVWETAHHKHTSIQPAHIYNVTVLASKPGAQTKRADKQFITAPRISKVEEPATRATDKDITVTMHVSDPRVNMFYSVDGGETQTYTDKQKITVPAGKDIVAWAESKEDSSLKSEKQTLINDGVFSGVEEIETADADAKWYDLQGRAVNAERLAPGIYVKVNGKKAVKVVVK